MSTIEKPPTQEYQERREAVLRDPVFIAQQEFVRRTLDIYKKSGAYERCLKRDPVEREKELQALREAGRLKDPVDAFMESAGYIAEEEFRQHHLELYKQSDRYQAYLKRKQAEKE